MSYCEGGYACRYCPASDPDNIFHTKEELYEHEKTCKNRPKDGMSYQQHNPLNKHKSFDNVMEEKIKQIYRDISEHCELSTDRIISIRTSEPTSGSFDMAVIFNAKVTLKDDDLNHLKYFDTWEQRPEGWFLVYKIYNKWCLKKIEIG